MLSSAKAHYRIRIAVVAFFLFFLLIWSCLPYDNKAVLIIRIKIEKIRYLAKGTFSSHDKHANPPGTYPVEISEVGMVIKTGYGTRDRLQARLETLGEGWDVENTIIAGDYSSRTARKGDLLKNVNEMEVHDVLEGLLDEEGEISDDIRGIGWELDILKHIPALELLYNTHPKKKWYLMTDDDTYTHNPSLLSVLSTLSPQDPHYVGCAIWRFAHGGSGVVFSQAAMYRIFTGNPEILEESLIEGLTAPLGDQLVAKLAMRNGMYVNEEYAVHFNGEPPRRSTATAAKACATLVGFHKLNPEEMYETQKIFGGMKEPFTWWDLWAIYGGPDFKEEEGWLGVDIKDNWDYVGWYGVEVEMRQPGTELECMSLCEERTGCLAWTWQLGKCKVGDFFTVGGYPAPGKISGVHIERMKAIETRCHGVAA
ncbi:glycosyltransferase family 31 protein [Cadophora sp. DSE1049]|nr:glycosyltransferase family 31 protein [Cadophora sp. DSE1049]